MHKDTYHKVHYLSYKAHRIVKSAIFSSIFACSIAFSLCPNGYADSYYDQGVALYNKAQYKNAAMYFSQSLRNAPSASALYYASLCCQHLGNQNAARNGFSTIIQCFPKSLEAQYARKVIGNANSDMNRTTMTSTSASIRNVPAVSRWGSTADLDSLPNSCQVPFIRDRQSILVEVKVNGKPINMVFDTGAYGVGFSVQHFQQLGIPLPRGQANSMSGGVGSTELIKGWDILADVQLGSIYRRNFPVHVAEKFSDEPLLGQSFLRDFNFEIDNRNNVIRFTKKSSSHSEVPQSTSGVKFSSSGSGVPFEREGNHIIMTAEINGRKYPVYFDTGASNTVFTMQQIKELGITIPDDAREGRSRGVGGTTRSWAFTIPLLRIGPITQKDFEISVVEESRMTHPLLGQTFFGNWRYTIDNEHKLILFSQQQ
jgi:clan AA aspartic protease (TIGR02281 family)